MNTYEIEYQTHSANAKKMKTPILRIKAQTLVRLKAQHGRRSACFLARHDAYLDELTRRDTTEQQERAAQRCPVCNGHNLDYLGYQDGGGDYGEAVTEVFHCLDCGADFDSDPAVSIPWLNEE